MKSVVFIIESLNLGGAEKSLVTLLQNFDFNRYKVDLVTFHTNGFFESFLPKEVNRICLSFPNINFFDRLIYFFKRKLNNAHNAQLFWSVIGKYFEKHPQQYDIAIAYNQGFATYYTSEYIDATEKFCWINTDYTNAGYKIELDYAFYKKYNKVIAVSDAIKKSLHNELEKLNMHLEFEVIKDITDKEILLKQALVEQADVFSPDKISILTVGRLAVPKGLEMAVEACHLLKKKYHVEWVVVGEGSERKNLTKLIDEKGLSDDFRLIGAYTNPYPIMKACDIYVQTSHFEGLGLTVIEASYLNKPIVCTNFPTAHHILKNEETGLIVEMDAHAIADGVERLINDKGLKNRLVSNLEKQQNFDKEITLQKVEELLKG